MWMWGVERILKYLDEYDITIAIVSGSPVLQMSDRLREIVESTGESGRKRHREAVARVMPHLKNRRAELLAELQKFADPDDCKPLTSGQLRQKILRDIRNKGRQVGESSGCKWRVCWYSVYNHATGVMRDDATLYPPIASRTWLEVLAVRTVLIWEEGAPIRRPAPDGRIEWLEAGWTGHCLPGSTPPKGWREPPNFEFPLHWKPPRGWEPRKKAKVKRYNPWRTESTFRDSLPPD